MKREIVTIYTTSTWPGNVLRISARLIIHGTLPTAENPRAPYTIYQSLRNRKLRTIQKKGAQTYLLIVRGECPVVPVPQTDLTNLPFTPNSKEWTREVDEMIDRWIRENPKAVIADYRYADFQHERITAKYQQPLFESVG